MTILMFFKWFCIIYVICIFIVTHTQKKKIIWIFEVFLYSFLPLRLFGFCFVVLCFCFVCFKLLVSHQGKGRALQNSSMWLEIWLQCEDSAFFHIISTSLKHCLCLLLRNGRKPTNKCESQCKLWCGADWPNWPGPLMQQVIGTCI